MDLCQYEIWDFKESLSWYSKYRNYKERLVLEGSISGGVKSENQVIGEKGTDGKISPTLVTYW